MVNAGAPSLRYRRRIWSFAARCRCDPCRSDKPCGDRAVQTNQPLVGALIFPVGSSSSCCSVRSRNRQFRAAAAALDRKRYRRQDDIRQLGWSSRQSGRQRRLGALLAIASPISAPPASRIAAKIVAIAEAKTIGYEALDHAGLITVFVKAILCNWTVCLAIVAAMTTSSTIGKIACAYMPVFHFLRAGFEHSVVNMFMIPTG